MAGQKIKREWPWLLAIMADRLSPELAKLIELERRGNEYVAKCPFCASGTLTVDPARSYWRSWCCGAHEAGDDLASFEMLWKARKRS